MQKLAGASQGVIHIADEIFDSDLIDETGLFHEKEGLGMRPAEDQVLAPSMDFFMEPLQPSIGGAFSAKGMADEVGFGLPTHSRTKFILYISI